MFCIPSYFHLILTFVWWFETWVSQILFHIAALLTAPPPRKFCHQQHPAILRLLIFSLLSLASFIPFLFILLPSPQSHGLLHTNTEAVMKAVYFLFSSNPGAFFLELSKLLLFWICFLFALCLLIIMLSLLTCSFRATFSCATRACLSVCTSTLGAAYSVDLSAFFRAVDVYTETCLHYSDIFAISFLSWHTSSFVSLQDIVITDLPKLLRVYIGEYQENKCLHMLYKRHCSLQIFWHVVAGKAQV